MILSNNINDNINLIKNKLNNNPNLNIRTLLLPNNVESAIIYINTLSNQSYIENSIIYPLLFKVSKTDILSLNDIASRYICCYSISIEKDIDFLISQIKIGKCAVLVNGENNSIICNTIEGVHRSVQTASKERSLIGSKEAFVENLDVNISLIEEKINNNNFKYENLELNTLTKTPVSIIYIDNLINKDTLKIVKNKLNSISGDMILNVGYINQYLVGSFSLFPKCKITEKPDKVVSDLLHGKFIILVGGSSEALVLPVTFIDFLQGVEDYSFGSILGSFVRLLRFFSLIIVLTFSPIYLSLLEFNVEFLPLSFIKTLIDSRVDVPLTPFLEVFIMEILIEILREGSFRIPSPIGQTLGIVGGIVLGDSAIRSGLVSPTTLVVIAIEIICSFLITNYEMSLYIRIHRFFILICSHLLGLAGVIFSVFLYTVLLVRTDSFGIPYTAPFSPSSEPLKKDGVFLGSIKNFNTRMAKAFMRKETNNE